jgi:hypothetical protein
MELSFYGKSLMKFIKEKNHPLERYIVAIDSNLDDDGLLRTIAERIGIFIPDNEDTSVTLFLRLKEYLQQEIDVSRTRRLLNATPDQYPNTYANRLIAEV